MVCNEEKVQSMLNCFIVMKVEEKKKSKEQCPFLASEFEHHIDELDGPNLAKYSTKMTDLVGNIINIPNPGSRGSNYLYFGTAKKLPNVHKLFKKAPKLRKHHTLYDLYKRIDASYREYHDDEDVAEEWKQLVKVRKEVRKGVKSEEVAKVTTVAREALREEEEREKEKEMREFVVHVPLLDEKEIERRVLEKKKMGLLSKYIGDRLMEE
ncbi:Pre-mRNA-splicing factor ISY1-like [Spatholobus suberectus]|nr:Pre-mRNA-splicing factor ISY1-like [Spatholobus suberectus]